MTEIPYIDIHTHRFSKDENHLSVVNVSLDELECLPKLPAVSIGMHPWDIDKANNDEIIKRIEELASNDHVVAIGEIGLDKLIQVKLVKQEEILKKQLSIAEKNNKVVIIHCVKYYAELIALKKQFKASTPWIIHGFNKNLQIAEDLIRNGCFLSFGVQLLKSNKLQMVFREIPNEKIFLETDESNASIEDIYQMAANIKELDITELKKIILSNYNTCIKK